MKTAFILKDDCCLRGVLAAGLVLSGLLLALMTSPSSFAQQDLHRQPVGTTVKGEFTAGKKTIFLPEGNWTLIGTSETTTGNNQANSVKWANLWLAHTRGDVLRALVYVRASVDASHVTRWKGRWPCERTDLVFARNLSRTAQNAFCVAINHRVDVLSERSREDTGGKRAYLWLEHNGLRVPGTMISVEYYRSDVPGNYLVVQYYFNPEIDGFAPSVKSGWSTNDWHKKFIDSDPKKVEYVDQLSSWAIARASIVDRGFKREIVAPAEYSKWPISMESTQSIVIPRLSSAIASGWSR